MVEILYDIVGWRAFLPAFALVLTAVLTWPACWLVLARYRTHVSRGMRARSTSIVATVGPSSSRSTTGRTTSLAIPPWPLREQGTPFRSLHPVVRATGSSETRTVLAHRARAQVRRAQFAYLAAGIGFAVCGAVVLVWTSDVYFPDWGTFLTLALTAGWVAIPISAAVGITNPWWRVGVAVAWAAAIVAASSATYYGALVGRSAALWGVAAIVYWVFPQVILIATTSATRIRGASWFVAPSLLALVLATGYAWFAVREWGSPGSPLRNAALDLGVSVSLLVGLICYVVVMVWLYERKAVSDQGLLIRQWWVMCAVYMAFGLQLDKSAWSEGGWIWYLAFVPPITAAFLLAWLLMLPLRSRARTHRPVRLLLLRTFGHRGRSTRLLRDLTKFWRWVGSVELITASDLATETLEPTEFLDFLRRRTNDRFVRDQADLKQRLEALDLQPDGDGRFRVNEFLCRDDTWRPTVMALATQADVVLIDLRNFTVANDGVRFELDALVATVPLRMVVGIVDRTTDTEHLRHCLTVATASARESTPAMDMQDSGLTLLHVGFRHRSRDASRLLDALAGAATPP